MCCEPILNPSLTILKPSCAIHRISTITQLEIQNARFVDTRRVSIPHIALPHVIANRHWPSLSHLEAIVRPS